MVPARKYQADITPFVTFSQRFSRAQRRKSRASTFPRVSRPCCRPVLISRFLLPPRATEYLAHYRKGLARLIQALHMFVSRSEIKKYRTYNHAFRDYSLGNMVRLLVIPLCFGSRKYLLHNTTHTPILPNRTHRKKNVHTHSRAPLEVLIRKRYTFSRR